MTDLLDEKDLKILQLLKEDSSLSTRQIAKKTLIPITTIHNRIKKLKKNNYIKNYTVKLDYKKLGLGFLAIILVNCDYKSLRETKKDQHQLVKEISKMHEVENVDIVTGGTDLVVKVRVKDVQEYDNFLLKKFQKINGIDKTQSLIVIHEK